MRGATAEFTEYRPYRQGDDPKRLDWKLLARTDRAYLRITNDSATLETIIIVDASASMAFPAESLAKWSQSCRLTVGLASVAHGAGDPVGVLVAHAKGSVALSPKTRRGVVAEIARVLGDVEPSGDAPLAPLLRTARRSSRLVIVTDLLGDVETLLPRAREFTVEGDLYVAHVVAREELEPGTTPILATDPESPHLRRPLVEGTRDEYLRGFALWRDQMARSWRAAGATYAEIITDEPTEHAIRRITSARSPAPRRIA